MIFSGNGFCTFGTGLLGRYLLLPWFMPRAGGRPPRRPGPRLCPPPLAAAGRFCPLGDGRWPLPVAAGRFCPLETVVGHYLCWTLTATCCSWTVLSTWRRSLTTTCCSWTVLSTLETVVDHYLLQLDGFVHLLNLDLVVCFLH